MEAGGFPVEFPVFSNGESNLRPTAMLTRNLASMDVEESIRGNPMDGVVLLVGCDKTTPALLMGAASVDMPTIVVTGGPMLNGKLNGKNIGSGTAVWQLHEQAKAGQITMHEFLSPKRATRARPAPATPWAPRRPWPAWPNRSAPRCRTTPRFRPSTRAATCWRTCRASASSRWCKKT
jgi:dihydroxyacid dehydratase/phosphogluconate dehydratase